MLWNKIYGGPPLLCHNEVAMVCNGSFDFKENATLRAFAGFITLAIQFRSPVKK